MSKTLEKLVVKAENKGQAILNGRMWNQYSRDFEELREKYAIENDGKTVTLRHWGTKTLEIDLASKSVSYWYGESNSDRDSMNFLLGRYGVAGSFRYRPSIDEFSYNV